MTTKSNFLDTPLKISNVKQSNWDKLYKVSDYALDYNLHLFKGIRDARLNGQQELLDFRRSIFDSVPEDYKKMLFYGIDDVTGTLECTTTARLQERLLGLLIFERHRRDIALLNALLAEGGSDKKVETIELGDPYVYEIKSVLFKGFQGREESDDNEGDKEKNKTGGKFMKFAMIQNLEFDYEHELADEEADEEDSEEIRCDDDLLEQFLTDDIVSFNDSLKKLKIEGKSDDDIMKYIVEECRIGKVFIPMAGGTIFSGED
ncbi:hypothetical protein CANARDRAFT_8595 [[Candida] arabinofermentans NRRL YB-2248]|uniref:Uncharacterized protein n=1 Tax=[Candida] arabinofermentans NRRL YB-2248 TaxID=983967 RepID=A0A1E4SYN0_9ASCO|nr:hypothetical protein CANARDRAFT_8595 [[Candida] arabinofermentans NRRL YB-2248]